MTDEPVPDDAANGRKPPYPGFGAFTSLLDRLTKSGVPAVIDRQFVGGSGTNQSLMLGALTYLRLIDDANKPTQELHDLSEKEDERAAIFRSLVERNYAGAVALGPRATQGQLDQWFRQQGVSGETARKAQSFFLSLAKAGGLELSPHFKVTRPSPVPGRKRATTKKKPDVSSSANTPAPKAPPPVGERQIHQSVTALLDKIPAPGQTWTKRERDLLVLTFGNLLDLFHPVLEDSAGSIESENESDEGTRTE